jgi:hypothetical protein
MKKFIIIFLLIVFSKNFLLSQVIGGSTIVPGELAYKVGIIAGPSFGFLSGNYKAKCDYLFTVGNGLGFFINIVGTYPLDYNSDIYASLGYQYNKLETSAQDMYRLKAVNPKYEPDGATTAIVLMESKADLRLSYLNLDVYYKRKIIDKFYFLAGLGLFFNLKSEIEQNETIKDDRYVFDLSGKTSDLIFKGDLPNSNSILFSGRLGLGYDFYIKNKFIITPQVVLIYPFTNLTTTDTWKVLNINAGLQFLYIF